MASDPDNHHRVMARPLRPGQAQELWLWGFIVSNVLWIVWAVPEKRGHWLSCRLRFFR